MSDSGTDIKGSSLPMMSLMLLLGVCALQLQVDLTQAFWVQSELLFILPFSVLLFYFKPQYRNLLALLIGYLWALLFAHAYLQQTLPESLSGQDLVLQGVVVGLPDVAGKSVRFNFKLDRFQLNGDESSPISAYLFPTHLRLSWYYHKGKVRNGERWRLRIRLKPPHGMQNEGGFDYEKWLYGQGIHATGYIRKSVNNVRLEAAGLSIDGIRENLLSVLHRLPDKTYQGLLQALTMGHKSAISSQQWGVLRVTGTNHLMAISGLHIGLIAGMVFMLVRRGVPAFVCQHISAPQVAAIVSLFAAGFYALLAGFSVPTQRAFVMLLVIMLAVMMKRPALNLNTLALALVAVLLFNPIAVLSAGFWLSFLAVLIIALVSANRVYESQGRFNLWVQGVKVQWLIAVGMLPLSLLLFQQGSLVSPLANMLVIPLIGLCIVPLSLLASILSLFSNDLSVWLFSQISVIFGFVWMLLEWLAQIPLASWQRSSVPLLQSALGIVGVALLLMPRGFPLKYAGGFLLLPMLLFQTPRPAKGEFWMSVLDVGQGLSVLVQTKDHALLYDAGAKFSERFDIGQRVVLPYLQYSGLSQLDVLLISHKDNDHAGGAEAVLDNIPVLQLIASDAVVESISTAYQDHQLCEMGFSWQWNGVYFKLISTPQEYQKSNNQSCVLKVWNGSYSVLLPGDIELKVERDMLSLDEGLLQTDVLIAPHHGSNSSSSQPWLKKLKPQIVLVSAGYKNRFGHPTDANIKRYQQLGARVFNTAQSGMLQMKFPFNESVKLADPSQQRKVDTHYWNHRSE